MFHAVQEYLEHTASVCGEKTAFIDEETKISFGELQSRAKRIAGCLLQKGLRRKAAAIFLDKGTVCIEAMMGIVYAEIFIRFWIFICLRRGSGRSWRCFSRR